MKTNQLIKLLQKLDPEGFLEVCIQGPNLCGAAILGAVNVPSYYDGPANKIQRNDKGHIVGGVYSSEGRKITLNVTTISNLVNDEVLSLDQVSYSEVADTYKDKLQKYHSYLDENNKDINYTIVKESFVEWMTTQMGLEGLNPKEIVDIEDEADYFLKQNPKYCKGDRHSRKQLWNEELTVDRKIGCVVVKGEINGK